LQAARKEFDEARNFAEADDASVGDVGDVHFAEERQQMVLAETEHLDVFDDDHFVVAHGEERAFEQGLGIFLVLLGEELHGFVDAFGRVGKAFAAGIFAEADEHFVDQVFEGGAGYGGYFFGLICRGWFHWVPIFLVRPCRHTRRSSSWFPRALLFPDAPGESHAAIFRRSRWRDFPWWAQVWRILAAYSNSPGESGRALPFRQSHRDQRGCRPFRLQGRRAR